MSLFHNEVPKQREGTVVQLGPRKRGCTIMQRDLRKRDGTSVPQLGIQKT